MNIRKFLPDSVWIKLRIAKAFGERVLFRSLWLFPIEKNKVVCSNFNGKGYGDNPKYIAEEIIRRNKGEIYWLLKDTKQTLPSGIKPLRYGSLKSYYHLATAKVWIDNNRKEPYVVKRNSQFYVQTWHGSIPLKRIEKDAEDSVDEFYKMNAIRDARMTDLMIADSNFSENLYKNSFWYEGSVERLGTPRFDALFDETNKSKIQEELGISKDQYVVLYAPTFRNRADASVYDIDLSKVKKVFEKQTEKQVLMLVKMHPHIPSGYVKFDDYIAKDVSTYPDIYDLMKISDVLITDYSSTMFEFPIAEPKPVFCYTKDRDSYDRGFYFELDSLPFLFARSNQELIDGISIFDQTEYEKKLRDFYISIDLQADGHASEHIVDYIISRMQKRDGIS